MNKDFLNNENNEIQALLESFLRFRSAASKTGGEAADHLDEDSLAAFVDGDLTRRENQFFVSHLVDCSFCLHKTAELSQLRNAFAEESVDIVSPASQPAKVSEVLNNLFSRLFGSAEGAVFAHEEKPDEKHDEESSAKDPSDDDDEIK